MRETFLLLIGLASTINAQVDLGVTGGVPLGDFFLNRNDSPKFGYSEVSSAPRRYTLGPSVELRLRGPFAIEAGALYQRFGFDTNSSSGLFDVVTTHSFTTGNSWEFPILAKMHLRLARRLEGFVAAGPSLRHLSGITESGWTVTQFYEPYPSPPTTTVTVIDTHSPGGLNRRTSVGATVGAGLEFRAGRLRFSPGLRLTRWDTERTSDQPAASRLARTQAEALLTVSSAVSSRPEPAPARLSGSFEFGLLAGVSLLPASSVYVTDPFVTVDAPAHRFAAGALLGWRFHPRWSLEASFLARPFGDTETYTYPGASFQYVLSGWAWEVPLLLKWRAVVTRRSAALSLGAGPALRETTSSDLTYSSLGVAASAGLELRHGAVRLRPELRYTWFSHALYYSSYAVPRQDSLLLVLGLSTASRSPRRQGTP